MIHRGAQVADELARNGAIADVVIVGSGAAGAAAACVLAEAGLDVLVLEEGAPLRPEDRRRDVFSGFATRWRDAGMQVAAGRGFMPVLQGVCVGGTTVVNGAIMHRLPAPIHAAWVRDHGAGRFFDAASIERVFATLDAALDVAPTPSTVAGENNRLMAAGFGAIGLASAPIARNIADCEASARCLQGCPTRRKRSMDETLLPRAFAAGARLIADCRVERVFARGDRAAGVFARIPCPRSGLPGPRLTIHARRAVILAASAVSTPLLLARSGLRGGAAGPVGRRFQGHPGTAVLAAFDAPVRMWQGATQGHESLALWDERMKFEALALPPELGAVRMPGLGPALGARMRDYGHIAQWAVQIRAEAQGRVSTGLFGGKNIAYDPTDADVTRLARGVGVLMRAAAGAGAHTLFPGVHGLPEVLPVADLPAALRTLEGLSPDPRRYHCILAHLFGTAVMGERPGQSVVSPRLECHALPGLFVFDSSVFPTNLGVNPQHTISAVAWRAAEVLAGT
ncbi:GMC family oxidoreductase [Myxococcota bacterium]|nr:GMC family oxidoreductase [Myxococcota bacterium]